jgi:hypothetical protein
VDLVALRKAELLVALSGFCWVKYDENREDLWLALMLISNLLVINELHRG